MPIAFLLWQQLDAVENTITVYNSADITFSYQRISDHIISKFDTDKHSFLDVTIVFYKQIAINL